MTHTVVFKNPSQALQERLRETGPLPSDEERPKKKGLVSKKGTQKYDYEKIAEALEKLEEEDLLRVIQLINENKGPDTYIRSDVEGKFFSSSKNSTCVYLLSNFEYLSSSSLDKSTPRVDAFLSEL